MLSIRTNVGSLDAQRNLSTTQNALESSVARLSSGMRITKAGDDAAGLGISTNLEAQVASYNQAARNANDGISVAQTAEGSLNEVSNILSRLRELTMQAASDGVGADGLAAIGKEATALTGEIDRIGKTAEYNGTNLFAAATTTLSFQVGIRGTTDDAVSVTTTAVSALDLGIGSTTFVPADPAGTPPVLASGFDITTSANAKKSLASIDAAITTVSGMRADLGAVGNRLQSAVSTIQTASENLSAANSRIRDVDVAEETSKLSRSQILAQAGISVLAQANQMPQMALKLLG
jgi:flagellin